MLLQDFQESVLNQGEISFIVIGGRCTHAVCKRPKAGDFRVQDDHGGTVTEYHCSAEEAQFAERAVLACPEMPLYARVDVVRDQRGGLVVMELELLEPELFFRFHPPAADALAHALAKHLVKKPLAGLSL
jgi:glutathione synthase/RimK-type ligase-like ATP-grasp enzyme